MALDPAFKRAISTGRRRRAATRRPSADVARALLAELSKILAFGVVITLIVDLDRPREGLLQVDLFPLQDLQRQLAESGP